MQPTVLENYQEVLKELQIKVQNLEKNQQENALSILCSSNDLDKLMPALIVATGAASSGMKVDIFFTLWGCLALQKKKIYKGKGFLERMMMIMTPKGLKGIGLSKMNMMGMGPIFMKLMMKKHNIATLEELIQTALDLGINIHSCQMTMGMMGITKEEMIDGISYCGAAAYIEQASRAKVTLFIG